jgi:uncharacterized membrane protein
VRLPAVLVPGLALGVLALRPWRWRDSDLETIAQWAPGRRLVWTAATATGVLLFWIVMTRFYSGEINAVDFTVYFDRPCHQTLQGRPLLIETSDDARFSNRGELADHAYWAMFPLCSLYAIHSSPVWLLAVSVVAVVIGAVYAGRIIQQVGGGGLLAAVTALAFVLNDNTARTLNYGFHPEVLYAWFIPWMIDAGLRRRRAQFVVATFACVLVKESACMPVFAATMALALARYRAMSWTERSVFLVLPNVLALANLGMYHQWVVPRLTEDGRPTLAYFWEYYGPTPILALLGMARRPGQVLVDTATSGFFTRVITPHLFLPLVGWRWMAGAVPIIVIFGASTAEQVRAFGIYYAIPLVPFLVIAAATGALTVALRAFSSPARARIAAAAAVLLGALLVGSGDRGYSLRPWKKEIAAVPEALARLSNERLVLVQSGLFPHAGYEERVRLLTRETLTDPRSAGAVVLVARDVNAYPFESWELEPLTALAPAGHMPEGLLAVRLTANGRSHKSRPGRHADRDSP